jgi:flavin reductase (DIM6/NTAB) family NADH-FMN oxidoreductase RutF
MDPKIKKTVLRQFTYGLYVVAARSGPDTGLMTANWITQVSFEPPLVVLAAEVESHTRALLEASGAFAVNILGSEQRELAGQLGRTFAKHPAKTEEFAWRPGPETGSPILESALSWVECRVVNSLAAGDHVVFLAEVVEAGAQREGKPLTLADAGFRYAG